MPRTGTGSAAQLPNTIAVGGEVIRAQKYNSAMADIYGIFNTEWPASLLPSPTEQGAQPINANLTSLSALGTAADKLAYTTGAGSWAETNFPAWARTFLAGADIATSRLYLNGAAVNSISNLAVVEGDVIYGLTGGLFQRLAKGAAGQTLRINAGATAPEWGYQSLGDGQTWQNMLATRAYATSYQNLTGRSIQVSISTANDNPGLSTFLLEVGVTVGTYITVARCDAINNDNFSQLTATIPNNHFYRVRQDAGPNTAPPIAWAELR